MRSTTLIAFALLAAMPALADDASAAAHQAVRNALLEGATLPLDHPKMPDELSGQTRHEHAARARHEEAERAAHSRAAAQGARHSREMRPEHGAGSSMNGPMHGGSGGAGMDSGMDCHDPAGNQRTRGMHEGWTPGGMDMGM